MIGTDLAAWAALAAFSCLYVLGAAVAVEGIAAARGVSLVAALGAAFSVALAVSVSTAGHAWQYAAAGAVMIASMVALHIAVNAGPVRGSRPVRLIAAPAAKLLARLAAMPGIAAVLSPGDINKIRAEAAPADVTAALAQNIERLEQTGLNGDTGELRMIKAVLSMDTARVREIMRPRVDMVAARSDATADQLISIINERGHSKIPVYAEAIDEIVGVVYARDLLRLQNGDGQGPKTARDIARPAIFVPESQRLEQLLREFQRHRTQIAIVVDEYGGVSGLVTVQDLIEEIVGEIVDEFDRNEPDVERVNEREATMDARLPIDSLNELFGVTIVAEGFDTVGGLVYRELGKMPVVGDTVDVQSLRIAVESTMGRRIRRLRVKRIPEMSDTPV